MENQNRDAYLAMLRQLVAYTSMDEAKKEFYYNLLTDARYDQMTVEQSQELMNLLPAAQDRLEKMIIDNEDAEQITMLANIKTFSNDLLNNAEEKVLTDILSIGGEPTSAEVSPTGNKGSWLLDKLAGLAE